MNNLSESQSSSLNKQTKTWKSVNSKNTYIWISQQRKKKRTARFIYAVYFLVYYLMNQDIVHLNKFNKVILLIDKLYNKYYVISDYK